MRRVSPPPAPPCMYMMIGFRVRTKKEIKVYTARTFCGWCSSSGLTPKSHYPLQTVLRVRRTFQNFRFVLAAGWLDLCRCLRCNYAAHFKGTRGRIRNGPAVSRVWVYYIVAEQFRSRNTSRRAWYRHSRRVYVHSNRHIHACFIFYSTDYFSARLTNVVIQ